MEGHLLKAEEAAKILNVRRERVYQLVRTQILPAVRIGRQIRFERQALDEFIAGGGVGLEEDRNARS